MSSDRPRQAHDMRLARAVAEGRASDLSRAEETGDVCSGTAKPETERSELSHVDPNGTARMVDVSRKDDSQRVAEATGAIRMAAQTLALIQANGLKKGDVLTVARVAGTMAAKRTAELIPLCHQLPLTGIEIELTLDPELPGVRALARVRCIGRTGVEMEALTAVSVCLLTIYDMAKAVDRAMEIGYISVLSKIGGKSDPWQRA